MIAPITRSRTPSRRRRRIAAPAAAAYVVEIGGEVQLVSLDETRAMIFAGTYNAIGGNLPRDERPPARVFLADVVLRPDGELPIDADAPARADARIAELVCLSRRRRERERERGRG